MKHLTENAEEKIKDMDFCLLEGSDDSKYGVRTIDEVVERYIQDCEDNEEKPHTELEVNLFKYKPFFNCRRSSTRFWFLGVKYDSRRTEKKIQSYRSKKN